MPVSVIQTQTITVQAIFETVHTVYFKHEGRTVATKELTDTQPSVSTGDVLVPVGADEKLTGWYIGETPYETVSTANFPAGSDTLTLTAKVDKGHWIHFNSAGGSYVAPQFVTGNTIPPADPARPGFSFEGWYEESGKQFTFGSPLTSNITLTGGAILPQSTPSSTGRRKPTRAAGPYTKRKQRPEGPTHRQRLRQRATMASPRRPSPSRPSTATAQPSSMSIISGMCMP